MTEEVKRDVGEIGKVKKRDGDACVVTGAAGPDICHIFPFAAKHDLQRITTLINSLAGIYSDTAVKRLRHLLAESGSEILDTAANKISLNPLLYRWWSKGLIGFEPRERLGSGVRVKFWWLKTAHKALTDKGVDLAEDPRNALRDPAGVVTIYDFRTPRPILSRTLIDIVSDDPSLVPNWEILELQWDLIRMCSLCGAGEAPDEEEEESDSDSDDGDGPIYYSHTPSGDFVGVVY